MQVFFRSRQPYFATRVDPLAQGFHLHSVFLILPQCVFGQRFHQRLEAQEMLVLACTQTADEEQLAPYFRADLALEVEDFLGRLAVPEGILIGGLKLSRDCRVLLPLVELRHAFW